MIPGRVHTWQGLQGGEETSFPQQYNPRPTLQENWPEDILYSLSFLTITNQGLGARHLV